MVVGRVSIGMPQRADTVTLMRHAPSSFRHVVAATSIGVGSVVVPPGASGVAFDLSQDEIEVEFYSPKHVIAFATLSQLAIT